MTLSGAQTLQEVSGRSSAHEPLGLRDNGLEDEGLEKNNRATLRRF